MVVWGERRITWRQVLPPVAVVEVELGGYKLDALREKWQRALLCYPPMPLYVVAPASTVDLGLAKGTQVPLEERSSEEVLTLSGVALAPAGAEAWNPAFDVTPGELIGAIITERGVAWPPFEQSLARAVAGGSCLP